MPAYLVRFFIAKGLKNVQEHETSGQVIGEFASGCF